MKIATYNVNGVIGRLPVLLRWLKEDAPDVVCLQELKTTDEKFPRRELQNLGYEGFCRPFSFKPLKTKTPGRICMRFCPN